MSAFIVTYLAIFIIMCYFALDFTADLQ